MTRSFTVKARTEKPKTAEDVKRILAEQEAEAKKVNKIIRAAGRGRIRTAPERPDPGNTIMNEIIRGAFSGSDAQPSSDEQGHAPGNAGEGTGQPPKDVADMTMTEAIREVLRLRKLLERARR